MNGLEGAFYLRVFVKQGPHDSLQRKVGVVPGYIHRDAEPFYKLPFVVCFEGKAGKVGAHPDQVSRLR